MARERYRRGGTAPNQVCICVDEIREGEFGGKVYSRYSRNPWEFHSLIELLGGMESFYNKIAFPQSAVQLRGRQKNLFWKKSSLRKKRECAPLIW